jgi:cytochrome c peroxidase
MTRYLNAHFANEEGRMSRLRWMAAGVVAAFAAASVAAAADDTLLLKQAQQIFKTLPKDMGTPDNPLTTARVELGRMLFFDPRFTIDANMSCATCHQPALYGTDGLATSIGVQQRPHPRNAPTILNSALSITHWRGDRDSVEDQVIKALTSPITFGQPDEKAVLDRLSQIPGYAPLFKAAFPDDVAAKTAQNIAKAIGAFERTLVTPSPFDAYIAGNVNALTPTARAGLEKFISTGCIACHEGVGVGGAMYRKFGVIEDYWKATGSPIIDKGRIDVTKASDDLYVFRVPSLRNVAVTAPYFHDGSVAALPDAVKVMARVQLGVTLTEADTRDIVAFLDSLTGELPAKFSTIPALPPGSVNRGK